MWVCCSIAVTAVCLIWLQLVYRELVRKVGALTLCGKVVLFWCRMLEQRISPLIEFIFFSPLPPKGSRGCLMSPPCLESRGCYLVPLCYLLSCSSVSLCYCFCLIFFSACWSILLNFFQKKLLYFSLKDRLFFSFQYGFCLAARRISWSVVCVACCRMALVFAVVYLY